MRERRAAGTDAVNTKVSGSAKARAGSAKDLVFGMGGACVVLAALAVLLLPRTKGPTVAAPAPGSTAAAEGSPVSSRRVFTPEALAVEGGGDKGVLLLAILGDVYDVTAGANHYGSGASYNCFVGRDATRAFVSGRFQGDGLTDDIKGLDGNDLEGIVGWHEFYMTSEKYHPVGVVVGRYYDAEGKSRAELDTIHATVDMWKRSKEKDKVSFPPCNSRWAAGKSEVFTTPLNVDASCQCRLMC